MQPRMQLVFFAGRAYGCHVIHQDPRAFPAMIDNGFWQKFLKNHLEVGKQKILEAYSLSVYFSPALNV